MRKIFLTLLWVSLAISAYSQSGVIRELTGDVELKLSGSSVFIPAQAGNVLTQDTIISTGFKSTAIVAVGSTLITVRPLTRLSLAEISSSQNTENVSLGLQAGRIRVDVKPPAGTRANTTVQSPSATASVRGTEFNMDIFNMDVLEGLVSYKGKNGYKAMIYSGNKGTVNLDGSVKDPVDLGSVDLMPDAPEGAGSSGEKAGSSDDFVFDGDVFIQLKWD